MFTEQLDMMIECRVLPLFASDALFRLRDVCFKCAYAVKVPTKNEEFWCGSFTCIINIQSTWMFGLRGC